MIILRENAPAKINLYLHVVGRKADGYHLLDSLVAFAEAAERLSVAPADEITLTLDGPFSYALQAQDNSVLAAAKLLQAHAGIKAGAALTLHKSLPVAAGIGGGSADAAAALRLLARFWRLDMPPVQLMPLAQALGADVPACLDASSQYMEGIGERLEPGPLMAGMPVVLVNPGKPLLTPKVFAQWEGAFSVPAPHPGKFASQEDCILFLQGCRNDLQTPAIRLMPEIASLLAGLAAQKACLLARMSGSGATCFGIFKNAQSATEGALALSAAFPGAWVKQSVLL